VSKFLKIFLKLFSVVWGGLWVGGKIIVDTDTVRFSSNALNDFFHEKHYDAKLRLFEIDQIQYLGGIGTGIIHLHSSKGELTFRCYGAKQLAEQLSALIEARFHRSIFQKGASRLNHLSTTSPRRQRVSGLKHSLRKCANCARVVAMRTAHRHRRMLKW
jgi:hypothetical protein